jgi:hypothetical protein
MVPASTHEYAFKYTLNAISKNPKYLYNALLVSKNKINEKRIINNEIVKIVDVKNKT